MGRKKKDLFRIRDATDRQHVVIHDLESRVFSAKLSSIYFLLMLSSFSAYFFGFYLCLTLTLEDNPVVTDESLVLLKYPVLLDVRAKMLAFLVPLSLVFALLFSFCWPLAKRTPKNLDERAVLSENAAKEILALLDRRWIFFQRLSCFFIMLLSFFVMYIYKKGGGYIEEHMLSCQDYLFHKEAVEGVCEIEAEVVAVKDMLAIFQAGGSSSHAIEAINPTRNAFNNVVEETNRVLVAFFNHSFESKDEFSCTCSVLFHGLKPEFEVCYNVYRQRQKFLDHLKVLHNKLALSFINANLELLVRIFGRSMIDVYDNLDRQFFLCRDELFLKDYFENVWRMKVSYSFWRVLSECQSSWVFVFILLSVNFFKLVYAHIKEEKFFFFLQKKKLDALSSAFLDLGFSCEVFGDGGRNSVFLHVGSEEKSPLRINLLRKLIDHVVAYDCKSLFFCVGEVNLKKSKALAMYLKKNFQSVFSAVDRVNKSTKDFSCFFCYEVVFKYHDASFSCFVKLKNSRAVANFFEKNDELSRLKEGGEHLMLLSDFEDLFVQFFSRENSASLFSQGLSRRRLPRPVSGQAPSGGSSTSSHREKRKRSGRGVRFHGEPCQNLSGDPSSFCELEETFLYMKESFSTTSKKSLLFSLCRLSGERSQVKRYAVFPESCVLELLAEGFSQEKINRHKKALEISRFGGTLKNCQHEAAGQKFDHASAYFFKTCIGGGCIYFRSVYSDDAGRVCYAPGLYSKSHNRSNKHIVKNFRCNQKGGGGSDAVFFRSNEVEKNHTVATLHR